MGSDVKFQRGKNKTNLKVSVKAYIVTLTAVQFQKNKLESSATR